MGTSPDAFVQGLLAWDWRRPAIAQVTAQVGFAAVGGEDGRGSPCELVEAVGNCPLFEAGAVEDVGWCQLRASRHPERSDHALVSDRTAARASFGAPRVPQRVHRDLDMRRGRHSRSAWAGQRSDRVPEPHGGGARGAEHRFHAVTRLEVRAGVRVPGRRFPCVRWSRVW